MYFRAEGKKGLKRLRGMGVMLEILLRNLTRGKTGRAYTNTLARKLSLLEMKKKKNENCITGLPSKHLCPNSLEHTHTHSLKGRWNKCMDPKYLRWKYSSNPWQRKQGNQQQTFSSLLENYRHYHTHRDTHTHIHSHASKKDLFYLLNNKERKKG